MPNGPNSRNHSKKGKSSEKSALSKVHPDSPSLRTTIPLDITLELGWEAGDVLKWEIEKRGDKYYVRARRLE